MVSDPDYKWANKATSGAHRKATDLRVLYSVGINANRSPPCRFTPSANTRKMEFGGARKRGRPGAALNGNGGLKKSKKESESFPTGVGSKLKPCTKFFSTSGCPFGEACHFLHYVPGGYKAVAQMMNLAGAAASPPAARTIAAPPSFPDSLSPAPVKTRMCNKYNTAEGCKFGDKCHFAHGEWELGKPSISSHEDKRVMGVMPGRMAARMEPPPPPGLAAAASFGASATAKISVDASLAGAIIGKGGVNSKQICRVTGAKLSIRDHESDPNLRNIELEGTFDQIKQASAMVRELIVNIGSAPAPPPVKSQMGPPSASNYKTKLCENFAKASCTFGDRCHFAHGAEELRKTAV
ncbi:hypothetical protein Nepgr_014667 [Nepenthes gracilis]|uniref:C3H1-type domain-containing protein n=1 Tax=Nepenthes gracilis TaxID=150966 RepID=A0AAD3XQJ3_NEPGR|nr:hypothetical protein Nepgr_014667 [Nepenthes gracilis]